MKLAMLVPLFAACVAGQPVQTVGSVEGTVTDSVRHSPIGKVRVTLIPHFPAASPGSPPPQPAAKQPLTALTDLGGSFRLPDLAPGHYRINLQHMRYPWKPGANEKEIEVKAGESTRVPLSLTPGATLSGRILDEDGDPIQGCLIQLQVPGGISPGMPGFGMENSNDRGEFRVWGIAAGRYILSAQCGRPPFQPRPFSAGPPAPASVGYPMQFYPAASDVSAAQPLALKAGEDRTGLDFRLKPAPVYTVSGVITAPEGRSVEHVGVNLVRENDRTNRHLGGSRVGPKGEFQIQGVFPGTYELTASLHSPNMLDSPLGGQQTVTVSDRPVQVQLALYSAIDLPGSVAVEGDKAYQVSQTSLQLVNEHGRGSAAPPPAVAIADGSFVIKNVLPGRWRVIMHAPNAFLKGIDVAGRTTEGDVIDLPPGAAGPLRLILSTRTATVEGSGTPGTAYMLRETGDERGIAMHRSVTADPQGRVRVEGLAPGTYRVYEGFVPGDDFLVREITVAENEKLNLDLQRSR